MKRFVAICLIAAVFVLLLAACSAAPFAKVHAPLKPVYQEITEFQLYAIGLLSSAIVYVLNVVARKYPKVKLSRAWLSSLVFGVAFVLALIWSNLTFPIFGPFDDLLTFGNALIGFITALLIAIGPAFTFATLVYNIIWKRVLDWAANQVGIQPPSPTS